MTDVNSTSSEVYLPDDIFYDFYTHEAIRGTGDWLQLPEVPYTSIPLFYKGGSIVAQRSQSANTTAELRRRNFAVFIAPGLDGTACGDLYLDDGVSIEQEASSWVHFFYDRDGRFSMSGSFGYDSGVVVDRVVVLGGDGAGDGGDECMNEKQAQISASGMSAGVAREVCVPLTQAYEVVL